MTRIEIHEASCRGCQICVDLCPTDVFRFDAERDKAEVQEVEDCIACFSCAYACPARAIMHTDYHVVKNFYRDLQHVRCVERIL